MMRENDSSANVVGTRVRCATRRHPTNRYTFFFAPFTKYYFPLHIRTSITYSICKSLFLCFSIVSFNPSVITHNIIHSTPKVLCYTIALHTGKYNTIQFSIAQLPKGTQRCCNASSAGRPL